MPPEVQSNLLWIPLFPLLGAIFNLLFGGLVQRVLGQRAGRELVHLVAIGVVACSCFFSFQIVFHHMIGQGYERLVDRVYPWITSGETIIGFDLLMDRLSAVMTLVVTGVGLLIHIFSVGYMARDPGYSRYFAYLNLFTASMLILVLGKSLALTFVGWEGVGLCSYLLIGFWFEDDAKATAGRKAFIVNRIGDFGFILGLFLIYLAIQSLDVDAIRAACATGADSVFSTTMVYGWPLATVATLLLFLGCVGKSAQIPLFVWLPDAMAGPTPVSALIHAATMVTAGVYLVVRLNFLFALAPFTMGVIVVIAVLTALLSAVIAITQNDIKKVLAYSTVSQLGFMFLAAGMGAWVAAIFHLVTHAFFKACLFLGSGSVIEACHHDQDIRTMGGLKQKMPYTRWTFLISCLAIAGIFPFAGFFSKDEILLHAYVNHHVWGSWLNQFAWTAATIAAFCTAFYMFRLYYLTFEGKFRGDHHTWEHHVREHAIMYVPLVILAALATVGGLLGLPHAFPGHFPHVLAEWLEPVTSLSASFTGELAVGAQARFLDGDHVAGGHELTFMGVSFALAVVGVLFARSIYSEGPSAKAERWAALLGRLYRASYAKFWVDEIYAALIVAPIRYISIIAYRVFDVIIVDGLGVYGIANVVGAIGERVRAFHNGNVRRYLLALMVGVAIVLGSLYANPTISTLGPSLVHRHDKRPDAGGLRPTLGAQPFSWVWQIGDSWFGVRLGPNPMDRNKADTPQNQPARAPAPSGARGEDKGGKAP